jgi:phosphate transport system substrate-binding protein
MKPGLIGRLRKRALPLLLLAAANGSFAALPVPTDAAAVLRVHGSNTVGAKLAPMLIAGLFEAEGS